MRPRSPFVIVGAIVVLIVGFLALGAIVGGDWGPRHGGSSVTIVNPSTGQIVDGQRVRSGSGSGGSGSVIVVDNNRRGIGFFPFFPLIPLLFFGFLIFGFVFVARRVRHGWGPGGPGSWNGPGRFAGEGPAGPPPAWFDRWHEQAHRSTSTASAAAGSAPASDVPWQAPAATAPATPSAPAAPTEPPSTSASSPEAAAPAKPDDESGPAPA